MKIEVKAATNGNDAFESCPVRELARVLRVAADKLESGITDFTMYDCNGAPCGKVGTAQVPMVNTLQAYEEQGRMVAKARNLRDEGSSQAAVRHFRAMRALEKEENRAKASEAYERGYTAVRNVPRVEPFR